MAYENQKIQEIFDKSIEKMEKTVSVLKGEFQALRAGRANSHILDKIMVDYYGTPTPINQMANIATPEARVLTISVWDMQAIKDVEKAIISANLGINPSNDGKIIRLAFPELTGDRRKELAKQVKKMGEDSKIALRNERRDALDAIKKLNKDKEISDDELAGCEKDMEKQMSKYTETVEASAKEKEKEVLTV